VDLKKRSRRLVALTLALLIVSGLFGGLALAEESTRIARVESVSGEVWVKKAGGSKEFKAYRNMTLNQGDHIRTGKDSSAVLVVLDQEDKITIGSNTSMYLSELKDSAGGKSTSMNLWNGSAYVSASKKSSGDKFRVETPTAVMGIRGTNFTVSHNANETDIVVHSGVVEATIQEIAGPAEDGPVIEETTVLLFPTMQAYITKVFDELQGAATVETAVTVADLGTLSMDLAILQAIVENKQVIDAENQQVLEQIQAGEIELPPELSAPQEIEALAANVTQFVAAIIQTAVQQELITEEQAQELAAIGNIDLSQPAELVVTEQQRQRQQRLEEQKQRSRQQQQQQEQRRQEILQQNQELLETIQQSLEQQEQQNQEAQSQAEQEALERYLASLTEEERQQFLQNQQQLNEQTQPGPSQPETPIIGGGGGGGSGGGGDGGQTPQLAIQLLELIRGDKIVEIKVGVTQNGSHAGGLEAESFKVILDGQPIEELDVQATVQEVEGSSPYYELVLPADAFFDVYISELVIEVTRDGQTASRTISYTEPTMLAEPYPVYSFTGEPVSGYKYAFAVTLKNAANIKGLQLHLVYDGFSDFTRTDALAYESVTVSERTDLSGYYEPYEDEVHEIIYAFVLTPGQSSRSNDIGDQEAVVYRFELEIDSGWGYVALAKLIVVTEQGSYQLVLEEYPDELVIEGIPS